MTHSVIKSNNAPTDHTCTKIGGGLSMVRKVQHHSQETAMIISARIYQCSPPALTHPPAPAIVSRYVGTSPVWPPRMHSFACLITTQLLGRPIQYTRTDDVHTCKQNWGRCPPPTNMVSTLTVKKGTLSAPQKENLHAFENAVVQRT